MNSQLAAMMRKPNTDARSIALHECIALRDNAVPDVSKTTTQRQLSMAHTAKLAGDRIGASCRTARGTAGTKGETKASNESVARRRSPKYCHGLPPNLKKAGVVLTRLTIA